jgi:CBS domain-containing protein
MATLRKIMTDEVVSVSPEMSLRDAVELLRGEGISGVPVLSGEDVVGVLSVTDLIEFSAARTAPDLAPGEDAPPEGDFWEGVEEWAPVEEEQDPSSYFRDLWPDSEESVAERWEHASAGSWDRLSEHAVGEIMTRKLCFLPPDATVKEAARYMVDRDIHRVLVMDGARLLGIVSTTDIMRAVADGDC